MKKRSRKGAFLIYFLSPFLGGGLLGAYFVNGSRQTQEYKLAVSHIDRLSESRADHPGSLREYLKARVYYYGSQVPSVFLSKEHDYGPVDTEHLGGVMPVKDAFDPESDYANFKRKAK